MSEKAIDGEIERLRKQNAELLEALKFVLKSAVPNPDDHPTMCRAWKKAQSTIRRAEEGK